jgi:phage-related protein
MLYGIRDGVGNLFKWGASGIYNAFNSVQNIIKTLINWTWQGFDAVWRGIQNAVAGLGTVLRSIYEWFLNGLKWIGNELNKMLKYLFEVTEGLVMKYARWQASATMALESEILSGCSGGD